MANHMRYHLGNPRSGRREPHRVLRPGGWIVTATNGRNHMVHDATENSIRTHGAFLITKDTALLTARKAPSSSTDDFGTTEVKNR